MIIDFFNSIEQLAIEYNIPSWIWKPIIDTESQGVSNAVYQTPREFSVGLFQINTMAHPQYDMKDLVDPVENTRIAFRDFIKPAIDYVNVNYPDLPDSKKAEIVYFGGDVEKGTWLPSSWGIRPERTIETINEFRKNLSKYLKTPNQIAVESIVDVGGDITDFFTGKGVKNWAVASGQVITIIILSIFLMILIGILLGVKSEDVEKVVGMVATRGVVK